MGLSTTVVVSCSSSNRRSGSSSGSTAVVATMNSVFSCLLLLVAAEVLEVASPLVFSVALRRQLLFCHCAVSVRTVPLYSLWHSDNDFCLSLCSVRASSPLVFPVALRQRLLFVTVQCPCETMLWSSPAVQPCPPL